MPTPSSELNACLTSWLTDMELFIKLTKRELSRANVGEHLVLQRLSAKTRSLKRLIEMEADA